MNPIQYSIIIPARNEEHTLPRCIGALRGALEHRSHEIIVVINRCEDKTELVASTLGCRIVHDESKNLACIRNAGARLASGEVMITVDADSIVSANMFAAIEQGLSRGDVIGGGVLIIPERWSVGILLTGICLLPYVIFGGISAGLFFCKRSDFEAIGGFNENLVSVEDIDFARRLRAWGAKQNKRFLNLYRAYIVTSCRKFDRLGDWYFLLHPWKFVTLLKGRNQAEANAIWYDFPRGK